MNEHDALATTLEAAVPSFEDERGDWADVLTRAGRPERQRRRGRHLVVPALAAAAVAFALVLAQPFGDDEGGVLDRALAAVGDDPVLHLVTQSVGAGTLVDLDTGSRTPLRVVRETWFDPARGFRSSTRVGDDVMGEYAASADQPVRLRLADRALSVFTRDYRSALRTGRARVLGEGTVAGTPVYWIRVRRGGPPRQEVAVSRETYEPVFVRLGPPGRGFEERILELEALPAGTGQIPGPGPTSPTLRGFEPLPRRSVDRSEAQRLLDGRLAWPGERVGGLPLDRIVAAGERPYRGTGRGKPVRSAPPRRVVRLIYRGGERVLLFSQSPRLTPGLWAASARLLGGAAYLPVAYLPPPGTALVAADGRMALLRHRGLVVVVAGSRPALLRAGMGALEG